MASQSSQVSPIPAAQQSTSMELIDGLHEEQWKQLERIIAASNHKTIPPLLLSGPTGSGKSTFAYRYYLRWCKNNGLSSFRPRDILNLKAFSKKLRLPEEPIFRFLRKRLSSEALRLLDDGSKPYLRSETDSHELLRQALVEDLNSIINDPKLVLDPEYRLCVKDQKDFPQDKGEDFKRRNRFFIATACRKMLTRNPPYQTTNIAAIPASLFESEMFGYAKGSHSQAMRETDGLFQAADGGMLFLDEIGEADSTVQAKLLTVLQAADGRVQVRRVGAIDTEEIQVNLIFATNANLEEKTVNGSFRSDLYHRIEVCKIDFRALDDELYPVGTKLRLAEAFVRDFAGKYEFGPEPPHFDLDAKSRIEAYNWPGNLRELGNRIHSAFLNRRDPMIITVKELGLEDSERQSLAFETHHTNDADYYPALADQIFSQWRQRIKNGSFSWDTFTNCLFNELAERARSDFKLKSQKQVGELFGVCRHTIFRRKRTNTETGS